MWRVYEYSFLSSLEISNFPKKGILTKRFYSYNAPIAPPRHTWAPSTPRSPTNLWGRLVAHLTAHSLTSLVGGRRVELWAVPPRLSRSMFAFRSFSRWHHHAMLRSNSILVHAGAREGRAAAQHFSTAQCKHRYCSPHGHPFSTAHLSTSRAHRNTSSCPPASAVRTSSHPMGSGAPAPTAAPPGARPKLLLHTSSLLVPRAVVLPRSLYS